MNESLIIFSLLCVLFLLVALLAVVLYETRQLLIETRNELLDDRKRAIKMNENQLAIHCEFVAGYRKIHHRIEALERREAA